MARATPLPSLRPTPLPSLRPTGQYLDGLDALCALQRNFAEEHGRLIAALRRLEGGGSPPPSPRSLPLELWAYKWRAGAFLAPALASDELLSAQQQVLWSTAQSKASAPPTILDGPGAPPFDAFAHETAHSAPTLTDELSAQRVRITAQNAVSAQQVRLSTQSEVSTQLAAGLGAAAFGLLGQRTSSWSSYPESREGRHTKTSLPGNIRPPQKAFVVNLHRLVSMHEHLDLLHEFTKSTAIAALTLVSAQSPRDLLCTVAFLMMLSILYWDHELRYDLLSVQDLMNVVHLLPQKPAGNPNQLLQVLSVSKTVLSEWRTFIILVATFCIICLSWISVVSAWLSPDEELALSAFRVPGCEEESETLSVQLTVLTLMFLLHAVFTATHSYETTLVMPRTEGGQVWDVRKDGLPLRCRLLGLPSMWFQTREAKDRLVRYVDGVNPGRRVRQVFPEELAMYAISCDDDRREELALMLQVASYFDAEDPGDGSSSEPGDEAMGLELCFFVELLQHHAMPYLGEYVSFRALQPSTADSENLSSPMAQIRGRLDGARLSVREGTADF